ncbi:MAG: hypothetical protein QXD03_03855 [Candidatus Anstonellales archaeon]
MSEVIKSRVVGASEYVLASDEVKRDILVKYGHLADIIYNMSSINELEDEVYKLLLARNIIKWVFTEKGKDIYKSVSNEYKNLDKLFSSVDNALSITNKVAKRLGEPVREVVSLSELLNTLYGDNFEGELTDEDFEDVDEIDEENIDNREKEERGGKEGKEVEGYIDKIHSGYKRQIENIFLNVWGELYGKYVDGVEAVDGFIIPGGSILSDGEEIRYQGILKLSNGVKVEPNTMSNAIFEEFIGACRDCGVKISDNVIDKENVVGKYRYNPLLQKAICSGSINKAEFKKGWVSYSAVLRKSIEEKAKQLAVLRDKTGTDEVLYEEISGYIISLVVINYRDGLGTQLRFCCGDISKTSLVAKRFVERLKERDKGHKSIVQGKLLVDEAIVSETGLTATLSIYLNMPGYQAVPRFMGELLCSLSEGMFKPSLDNIIIGVDLQNNIVTAPIGSEGGWLLPIIAGSRSGKGVLTLNILLTVIGCGTPLFYLDGKPDMAALLWKLQEKHGIKNSMVVDGIGYKGITDVDRKPYVAPYANNILKSMRDERANSILEDNFGVMVYLKAMMCILLACTYYKEQMGTCYGDIFVVFDEVYKVMKTQMEAFINHIELEKSKLDKSEKEKKAELEKIKNWVHELLLTFAGNDIGVFGNGIKAVALTQFAQDTQYNIAGFTPAKVFCTNFLLKRGRKLFGRQQGGTGDYGVRRENGDTLRFQLYDKYFYFGVGTEQGNTYNSLRTFKPLLVLNENDCKELTGANDDGAFTKLMLDRIKKYVDVEAFRDKYFRQNRELAEAIGFEGALAQVGRLIGADWREMLRLSLERAYDITDKALRYYGIIGLDGIESVYDYITSFNTEYLWTYKEIIKAKEKGISLSGVGVEGDEEESILDGVDEETEDIKSIHEENLVFNGTMNRETEMNTSGTRYGHISEFNSLNAEEKKILKGRVNSNNIKNDVPFENNNSAEKVIVEEEGEIKLDKENPNVYKLDKDKFSSFNISNKHPILKYSDRLFKTLGGTRYELSKRWDMALDFIDEEIGSSLVTRVILLEDEMYANGILIDIGELIGGKANLRLEDIVNIQKLIIRFRNLKELTLDKCMFNILVMEVSDVNRIFSLNSNLRLLKVLLEDGRVQVIDKVVANESGAFKDEVNNTNFKNKFNGFCGVKSETFKDKNVGYKNRIWEASRKYSGAGYSK